MKLVHPRCRAGKATSFRSRPRQLLHRFVLLASLAVASISVGCAPTPAPALRVGINPWPGFEFMFLAQEKGYYREAGLEVRLVEFGSLSDARHAFERGQIDAMSATVVEVLLARERSTRTPQIVQVIDYSNGADVIVARPGITNAAGLRGARIGVEFGSIGVYMLARALEKSGIGLSDVKATRMDQVSMVEAFSKGEVDAVVSYPPTSVKLLREGKAHIIFSSAEIPGEVVDVIAIDERVNRERPADVTKFLRAFDRAVAFSQQDPAQAHRIMAEREGISAAEFAEALTDGVQILAPSDQAAYLQPAGKLRAVVDATDQMLRRTEQIKGADRRSGIANTAFVANATRP